MWVTNLWYNNERICVQKMSTSLDKKQNKSLINELKPSTSLALRQGGGGYKPCYSCTLAIWLGINEGVNIGVNLGVNIGVNIFVWFCDYCLVVLNLFQHLTSLEDLLVFNKILNSLKITDKGPYFLRFQNDILGGVKNNPRQASRPNTSMEVRLKIC